MRVWAGAVMASGVTMASCGGGGGGPDGPVIETAHPRIYLPRNQERLAALVATGHPAWTRFQTIVDAQLDGGNIYDFRAWFAGLAFHLTGEARYCEAAVSQIDTFVAEEEVLIADGMRPGVAFDSYLEVGPIIGDLAMTYDWCFDFTTTDQRARWIAYANQAVANVWDYENASWGGTVIPWSGWSIDNPSNNYYYSFLRATMTLGLATREENPQAETWLTMFRDTKIAGQLVPTFERDLVGGGSREGTGYGVAMMRLYEIYDLWHGSTGEALADLTGHTRASMLHMMHSTVPTLDRVAPIGDHARDSTASWFDYHRHYLQTLLYLHADDAVAPFAAQLLADSSVPEMDQPFMRVFDFLYANAVTATPLAGFGRSYWAPGVGQLYHRSSWATDATWMSFIAGPYTESHAHQDQGSFMLFKDSWIGYDGVVDSTSGLTQEPEAHSGMRFVDGGTTIEQEEGTTSSLLGVRRGANYLWAAADLLPAYDGHPAISGWQREVVMIEPDVLVVYDRVNSSAQQVWQFVSPASPTVTATGATLNTGAHDVTVTRLLPAGSTLSSTALTGDFTGGYRYESQVAGGDQRHLHVISIAGSAAAAGVTEASAGDQDGVSFAVGGQVVVVRFNRAAPGGFVQIGGTIHDLELGFDELPETN